MTTPAAQAKGILAGRRINLSGLQSVANIQTLSALLFVASLGTYLVTRLDALDRFPIYFFTDEAIGPALGVDLVRHGFRGPDGTLFPTYFQNGPYWNLSLSVYIHALTASVFGKSIIVTRATSALISSSAAIAAALIMKLVFRAKTWWVVVLFLAATPSWFLHSRTGFETVLMVSFYTWFLLFYLLYRYRSPRFLFPAILFAAATFYAYSNGQAVALVSAVALLLSDWRYHLQNRRVVLGSAGLTVVLALPYIRFHFQYPQALAAQLYDLNSYWITNLPLGDKIQRFVGTYLYGLSPQYWFIPNDYGLARHQMRGYGNISLWQLPFVLLGLYVCVRSIRSSAHRAILIAMLATPFGSALADVGITRVLAFIVPAAILAALGFEKLVSWCGTRGQQLLVALTWSTVVAYASLSMLGDALARGPTWYHDYGLYGMQWGTKQIFQDLVPAYLRAHPSTSIFISPNWANGTNVFQDFFDMPPNVRVESVTDWEGAQRPLPPRALFIMTAEDYAGAVSSHVFKDIHLDQIIRYPDGTPGFYVAQLAYSHRANAIFAAERKAELRPVTDRVMAEGQLVTVRHTLLDIGSVQAMFDGNLFSVERGADINPFYMELILSHPRAIHVLTGYFANSNYVLTVKLFGQRATGAVTYHATFNYAFPPAPLAAGRQATMRFDHGPAIVSRMEIRVFLPGVGSRAHVHVYELAFH